MRKPLVVEAQHCRATIPLANTFVGFLKIVLNFAGNFLKTITGAIKKIKLFVGGLVGIAAAAAATR